VNQNESDTTYDIRGGNKKCITNIWRKTWRKGTTYDT